MQSTDLSARGWSWLGTPISANNLLIAAHTLALQLTLVTHNTGEFRWVPGLAVEDWLE